MAVLQEVAELAGDGLGSEVDFGLAQLRVVGSAFKKLIAGDAGIIDRTRHVGVLLLHGQLLESGPEINLCHDVD